MAKPERIIKPSILPPMPITISRSAWAQKSIIHFISTFLGSIFSLFRFLLARNSSVLMNSCCRREVTATIARLWALVTLSISPVRPREKGVSGIHCERPPPAALPFILKVGPPEGWRIAPDTFLPLFARPGTSPMAVVLLPSPRGVGVMAVTSIYFALGLSFSRATIAAKSTLPR